MKRMRSFTLHARSLACHSLWCSNRLALPLILAARVAAAWRLGSRSSVSGGSLSDTRCPQSTVHIHIHTSIHTGCPPSGVHRLPSSVHRPPQTAAGLPECPLSTSTRPSTSAVHRLPYSIHHAPQTAAASLNVSSRSATEIVTD